jgi:outer membrane protein insertion porin family
MVEVIYNVSEGQRFYLDRVVISGNQMFSQMQLLRSFLNMSRGDPFDEGMLKQAKLTMEEMYYNSGKPFVELDFDYTIVRDSMIVIFCDIRENQTVTIKDMQYIGLDLVQQFIVYRELEIKRGDIYNREKLARSHKRLYKTNLFEYVRFELKPIQQDSSQAILVIQVQEKDPRWIGASLGFLHESEESYGNRFELSLEGGHRNLFGTARSLSLHVVPSFSYDIQTKKVINPDNHITLIFVEPWIFYTRTPGVFQTSYHLYRPLNSANFNVTRFNFSVSRELSDFVDLRGALEAKLVTLLETGEIDTTLEADARRDQVYSVSLYGKRDTRKNFFNPTDGSVTDLSASFSYSVGKLENGTPDNKTYLTLTSTWKRFQPVKLNPFKRGSPFVFSSRLRAGGILEFGETKSIPISDLFFAGGATSVRGYQEQLLGPATLDENGFKDKAKGGKLLLIGNLELRVPLFWLIVGEVFFDAGNVWEELEDFNPVEIKFSTGFGLVILTPVGPIRFDYGVKLNKERSDRRPDAFHFGLYFAF